MPVNCYLPYTKLKGISHISNRFYQRLIIMLFNIMGIYINDYYYYIIIVKLNSRMLNERGIQCARKR